MAELHVTEEVIDQISRTTAGHLERLNAELADAYPDTPDLAWSCAIGAAIAMTLARYGVPDHKAKMVEAINGMLAQFSRPVAPCAGRLKLGVGCAM
jgi:hypothetical protein